MLRLRTANLLEGATLKKKVTKKGSLCLLPSKGFLSDIFNGAYSSNLVPRVFSLSNMAAAGEKTLAHSELKRSLIGKFHGAFIRALSLVNSFQNKDG